MNILRASHLGMCFGVRDAISLVQRQATSGPVTVLGDLVHNPQVLDDLRRRGVRIERQLDAVSTPTVVITAHGSSDRDRQRVEARGHRVLEATCPLVRFAHDRVRDLARAGYHPVVVGQRDHVEVRGLTGDLEAFDVILEDADVDRLQPRPRFGVAAQTTQPWSRVQHLVERLRRRFPDREIRVADTVCMPTKQRQRAAEDLAAASDVVVVIGGAQSNNTRELVATTRRFCPRVHHVQSAADLRSEWFNPDDTVGITAGTSTPDALIGGVERWLAQHAERMPGPIPATSASHPLTLATHA